MKEQFVTYEIALKLKELGFDESCLAFYSKGIDKFELEEVLKFKTIIQKAGNEIRSCNNSSFGLTNTTAPLWQQAIDWLDKKYRLFITLALVANGYGFYIHIDYNTTNKGENYGFHPTFYIAREKAILKALEIIKNDTKRSTTE